MKDLQKLGGLAALYEAVAYVVGIVFFIVVVDYAGVIDPVQKVALLMDNQAAMHLITLIIYVVFGVALVVLALALHERLKAGAPAVMATATAFGLIWAGLVIASGMIFISGMETVIDLYGQDPAQAATVWSAIDPVFEGLGGGVELVGGLWVVLVSWAALQTGRLPRALNYFGLVIGVAGIITIIPALGELGVMVFGLGQIVWFVWLGIDLLRRSSNMAVQKPKAMFAKS
ncbi:MAG: DUF4386 family protein [Anaerolineaceae bacterium]|nr:DUF4386 family protein [Anaerolineaceae bacterium]